MFCLLLCAASAAWGREKITFTTTAGQTFTDVEVSRVTPDAIMVKTAKGIQKVPLDKIPPEVRRPFEKESQAAAAAADAEEAPRLRARIGELEGEIADLRKELSILRNRQAQPATAPPQPNPEALAPSAQAPEESKPASNERKTDQLEGKSQAMDQSATKPGTIDASAIRIVTIEGTSRKEGESKQFPYTVKWTLYPLPKTQEARAACKEIVLELKQISKVIELGVTYVRFCDLFQEKALLIEKLKERVDCVPPTFIKHVDKCLSFYKLARESWATEIESSEYPDLKASCAFGRISCWNHAGIELLYCVGIVEGDTHVSDAIMRRRALDIFTNETIVIPNDIQVSKRRGLGGHPIMPHPVVSKMTEAEILARFKMLASTASEVEATTEEP